MEYLLSSCFETVFEIISLACKLQPFITKTNDLLLLKGYSKTSTQRLYVIENNNITDSFENG